MSSAGPDTVRNRIIRSRAHRRPADPDRPCAARRQVAACRVQRSQQDLQPHDPGQGPDVDLLVDLNKALVGVDVLPSIDERALEAIKSQLGDRRPDRVHHRNLALRFRSSCTSMRSKRLSASSRETRCGSLPTNMCRSGEPLRQPDNALGVNRVVGDSPGTSALPCPVALPHRLPSLR